MTSLLPKLSAGLGCVQAPFQNRYVQFGLKCGAGLLGIANSLAIIETGKLTLKVASQACLRCIQNPGAFTPILFKARDIKSLLEIASSESCSDANLKFACMALITAGSVVLSCYLLRKAAAVRHGLPPRPPSGVQQKID